MKLLKDLLLLINLVNIEKGIRIGYIIEENQDLQNINHLLIKYLYYAKNIGFRQE